MKYVVGLGNPGDKYKKTRHNIGFMVVEKALEIYLKRSVSKAVSISNTSEGAECEKRIVRRDIGASRVEGETLWCEYNNMLLSEHVGSEAGICFVKPMTYMNLSGEIFDHLPEEVEPEDVLVVVDELYLELGRLRFRAKGSAGGHNGLTSIETALASREYNRLRVGVGREACANEGDSSLEDEAQDDSVIDFVLGEFEKDEDELLEKVVQTAAEGVLLWCDHDLLQAQQRYNGINLRF